MTELQNIEEYNNLNKDQITILDFYAEWCQPCKILGPILNELSNEHPEYNVIKVNTETFPELASKYGIMSAPTLIYIKNDDILHSSTGVIPKNVILKKLEELS